MKILLLSTSMGMGGADKLLLTAAQTMRSRGNEVIIVSLTSLGPMGLQAKALGIVSRIVPEADLDDTASEMAERVAAAPAVTVKMAREVLRHLSVPGVRSSMADEMIYQTFVNRSDDFAEFRASRAEERPPRYTGS